MLIAITTAINLLVT